ncbi:MAG: hypothetical protein ACI3W5_08575 [Faecousia sp.]
MATESKSGDPGAVISKDTFCKVIQLIKEQEAVNEKVGKALGLVGDGHFAFSGGKQYFEALRLLLKEGVRDKYDYIGWWLYEAEPDYLVWSGDEKQEWCLKELGDLYDFIQEECQD